MNYYERYCGDYARDTGHLSLQEHGAYTVMLDTYYATETPLPTDYKALYRICRAMSGKEREAVRRVADRFFPVGQDGLRHNKRADEVIAKTRRRIEAAKANGERGGRPFKEPSNNPVGLWKEPSNNPVGSTEEPGGHIGTSTRPHVPTKEKSKTLSADADGAFSKFWEAYPRKTARKKALEAFRRSKVANGLLDAVLASIEAHKATEQWQRGVIPHASTWLNQRRWEDELSTLSSLGECMWNVNDSREPGQPKCVRAAVVEKQGIVYCKAHGDRA